MGPDVPYAGQFTGPKGALTFLEAIGTFSTSRRSSSIGTSATASTWWRSVAGREPCARTRRLSRRPGAANHGRRHSVAMPECLPFMLASRTQGLGPAAK